MRFGGFPSTSCRGNYCLSPVLLRSGTAPEFREDWRPDDPVEAILTTCRSLLAVFDVDGLRIISFSVKEFLTSTRLAGAEDPIARRFRSLMTPAHTLMAQASLDILPSRTWDPSCSDWAHEKDELFAFDNLLGTVLQ